MRLSQSQLASDPSSAHHLQETNDPTGAAKVYDGAAVEAAIAESLAALRTNRIDLYQINWPLNIGVVGDEAACQTAGTLETVVSAVAALERARADVRA